MMEILKYPNEKLRLKSAPILKFDSQLHQTLDEMARTMYGARGVGLAGAQVGYFYRIFVIDIGTQDERFEKLFEFINPVIEKKTGKTTWEEGCLSLPGILETVTRSAKISMRFFDRHGVEQSLDAEELLAVAIQHEYDHLEGILYIDHLSFLKKRMIKRKLEKEAH